MAKIFISYSRADSSIVDNLFVKLQSAGHSIWVDRVSIQGGDQWRRQIVSAIETSDVFILVLSPNSIKSKNVRKELDLAEETDIQIIPIEIKPTNIPTEMKYQLVGLQRIDFSSSFDKGYEALLSAIDKNPILEMEALQKPTTNKIINKKGTNKKPNIIVSSQKSTAYKIGKVIGLAGLVGKTGKFIIWFFSLGITCLLILAIDNDLEYGVFWVCVPFFLYILGAVIAGLIILGRRNA